MLGAFPFIDNHDIDWASYNNPKIMELIDSIIPRALDDAKCSKRIALMTALEPHPEYLLEQQFLLFAQHLSTNPVLLSQLSRKKSRVWSVLEALPQSTRQSEPFLVSLCSLLTDSSFIAVEGLDTVITEFCAVYSLIEQDSIAFARAIKDINPSTVESFRTVIHLIALNYALYLREPNLFKNNEEGVALIVNVLKKLPEHTTVDSFLRPITAISNEINRDWFLSTPLFFTSPQYVVELKRLIQINFSASTSIELKRFIQIYLDVLDPDLAQRTYTLFTELKQYSYSAVSAEGASNDWLQQINSDSRRLGRDQRRVACDTNRETTPFTLVERASFFSPGQNLGELIIKHFGKKIGAIYCYSIYENPNKPVRGVVLNNYSGYGSSDASFTAADGLAPQSLFFLSQGYRVITLLTRDNWQTLLQSTQFGASGPSPLFIDVTMQILLFAQAVKNRYPQLPQIYFGASFGAGRAAWLNFICSHKGQLKDALTLGYQSAAEQLEPFLNKIDASAISAYIAHDGEYGALMNASNKRSIRYPIWLGHNFDDARVDVNSSTMFAKRLIKAGTPKHLVSLHISPQGADSWVQVPDGGSTSLSGHFMPYTAQYKKAYKESILSFLDRCVICPSLSSLTHKGPGLTQIRYTHFSSLAENSPRAMIYRYYMANIHAQPDSKSALVAEIHKAIAQYTRNKNRIVYKYTDEQLYHILVEQYGSWLISTVLQRHKELTSWLLQQLKQHSGRALESAPNFLDHHSSSQVLIDDAMPSKFVLTEDAWDWLKDKDHYLGLVLSATSYAVVIDRSVLEYLSQHLYPLTHDDLTRLWGCSFVGIHLNTMDASKAFSVIRVHYPEPGDCIRILKSLQEWEPIRVIHALGVQQLDIHTLELIMQRLLTLPLGRRDLILRYLGLISLIDDAYNITVWACDLDPQTASQTLDNYLIAAELFSAYNNSVELLARLRTSKALECINLKNSESYHAFVVASNLQAEMVQLEIESEVDADSQERTSFLTM